MNLLVKRVKGKEYLIKDFMATSLSRKKFEDIRAINEAILGEWEWCDDIDWTWWDRVHKKLTPSKIRSAYFRYDIATGKVQEW